MTKTNMRGKVACLALLGGMAATMMSVPAIAGDIFERDRGESMKDAPMETGRRLELSANVGLTSDYVFRGVSQTAEHPAIQGGFDATYGMLYAGVWASNLDFGGTAAGKDVADIELDLYVGITPKLGPISLDLGVIGYLYPGASDQGAELDFLELKAGATVSPADGLTLGGTAYYSPEYTGKLGETWTLEGNVEVGLPKLGMITPTFSALVGTVIGQNNSGILFGQDEYVYWNVGLGLAYDKFNLDVRYWDTDVSETAATCSGSLFQCDSRFVVGLTASF
ncbi:MAG: TorF family putative porin [Hyphomicrobiaceae bacterium]|nr:TorF family putative porin [Hyphomicrobiaceae bacterium]